MSAPVRRVRRWTREDLPAIAALEQACFSEPWSLRALEDGFANPDFACWVCEQDGEIAGYANAVLAADEAQIANVATASGYRRQGVARTLLETLLEELQEAGYTAATLEVRPSNAPARALYHSLGFVCEGVRRRFYSDGEDAQILWKHFASGLR